MRTIITQCTCCGQVTPASAYAICDACLVLPASQAVPLAVATTNRLRDAMAAPREKRKAAQIASYATDGKRCTTCHAYKPPRDYHACAARYDGLQPECIACAKLRVTLPGTDFRAYRAALRASAAAPVPAAK